MINHNRQETSSLIRNTNLEKRPTLPLPNMLLTQSDTHIAKFLFRNRTWFTMTDLSRLHVALISWSATEKSRSDGMLVPQIITGLLANEDNNG